MKRFKNILRIIFSADILLWLLPIVIIIPNVLLDITESTVWITKIVNIIFPLGIYILLASTSRNVGRTGLFFLPLMLYSAFQIVLLYLYGESIIAIDMLLNIVTTNVSEATELLGNLVLAIIIICILYIPIIIWSIMLICGKIKVRSSTINIARHYGIITTLIGIATLCLAYAFVPQFSITRDIFPINVVSNTISAIKRTIATTQYHQTSKNFNFEAYSTRPDHIKEIYVLVIGETSRAENWQLFGYDRPTNPYLAKRDSLLVFTKALSESNTTHKSVPLMLAPVTTSTFGDSIYIVKSVISAFNQAGYYTAFFSNQSRNHSFTDFFSQEACISKFLNDDGLHHYDHELVDLLHELIANSTCDKLFVILHTYGSHFNYNERYPVDDHIFTPDQASNADKSNRSQLINAYDNSIIYTDRILDQIITDLDSCNCLSALLYLSDHGEDIFDDDRNRFLHASPVPTYYQLHIPMIMWMSTEYINQFQDKYQYATDHQLMDIASNRIVFDTLLSIAGIYTNYFNASNSIVDNTFKFSGRYYLNDYNEEIDLKSSGLHSDDLDRLSSLGIFIK